MSSDDQETQDDKPTDPMVWSDFAAAKYTKTDTPMGPRPAFKAPAKDARRRPRKPKPQNAVRSRAEVRAARAERAARPKSDEYILPRCFSCGATIQHERDCRDPRHNLRPIKKYNR